MNLGKKIITVALTAAALTTGLAGHEAAFAAPKTVTLDAPGNNINPDVVVNWSGSELCVNIKAAEIGAYLVVTLPNNSQFTINTAVDTCRTYNFKKNEAGTVSATAYFRSQPGPTQKFTITHS